MTKKKIESHVLMGSSSILVINPRGEKNEVFRLFWPFLVVLCLCGGNQRERNEKWKKDVLMKEKKNNYPTSNPQMGQTNNGTVYSWESVP